MSSEAGHQCIGSGALAKGSSVGQGQLLSESGLGPPGNNYSDLWLIAACVGLGGSISISYNCM